MTEQSSEFGRSHEVEEKSHEVEGKSQGGKVLKRSPHKDDTKSLHRTKHKEHEFHHDDKIKIKYMEHVPLDGETHLDIVKYMVKPLTSQD